MYKPIEIDFDVYKELTVRRDSPDMTENDVIRNLLGLRRIYPLMGTAETEAKTPWVGKELFYLMVLNFVWNLEAGNI